MRKARSPDEPPTDGTRRRRTPPEEPFALPNLDQIRPAMHQDLRDLRADYRRDEPPPEADGPEPPDDEEYYPEERRSGWLGNVLYVVALAFLAFLAGAYIVLARVAPYETLKGAYEAGLALIAQRTEFDDPLQTDLWADARSNAGGVTIVDRTRAFIGPTLFTSGHESAVYLIDIDGRPIHRWRLPFSEVWDETAAVSDPRPDPFVFIDKAYMYPNGDLLAVYTGVGDTPWGLGLVKMDRESRVIWKYLERAHHDVEVGADGRIYTLTQAMRDRPVDGMPQIELPFIEDFLVVLSPDGKVERRISLMDAVAASPYRKFFAALTDYARQDPLHTNAAKPVDGRRAAAVGGPATGGVLLSFRESSLVAMLDPETGRLIWGARGPWLAQHDPTMLENGNILLFDNLGSTAAWGNSRVLEFNPRNAAIEWSYLGSEKQPLESELRSGQQRLPNGNTLITESDGGRLLEVTRQGEIVWEYINPIRGGAGDRRIPVLSSGRRYAWTDLDPDLASAWRKAN